MSKPGITLGQPGSNPCPQMKRVKSTVAAIEEHARDNVTKGRANAEGVDSDIRELRQDAAKTIGGACAGICGKENRCILESFGADDPLLRKDYESLTEGELRELNAKRQYDMLRLLLERAMGIALM